jgi:tetratricopeptide (TPR) repeat protein
LQKRGRLDDAIAEFREFVRIVPDNATARNHLAGALFDNHDLEAAIREWRAAIAIDPKDAMLYGNLGLALAAKGNRDDAIAMLQEGIRIDPKAAHVRTKLASVLYANHDFDGTIRELRAALEIWPKDALLHNNLAVASLAKGDVVTTLREFEQAIRIDSKLVPARNSLAWLLATTSDSTLRDPPRAVEVAKQAVQLAPKDTNAWRALGAAQCRVGDYDAAVTSLQAAMQIASGGDSAAGFFLAMAEWQRGSKDQARKRYQQAVNWMDKNSPNDEELRRFRTEAASLLMLDK